MIPTPIPTGGLTSEAADYTTTDSGLFIPSTTTAPRFEANGRVPAEPVEQLHEPVDDAELWPVVRDRKGREIRSHRPDPAAVEAALRRSRAMQEYDVAELAETPSSEEIAEMIAQGARHRADLRALEDARHQHHLDQQRAQMEHEARVADQQRQHANHLQSAHQRRDRATDPTTTLLRLARAEKWIPGLALVPAVFAVVAGAVNVFHELSRINPETWLINWAIEPLFTWPLVVIVLAQMLGALPKPDLSGFKALRTNRYVGMEIGLTVVAIGLNVGLHWLDAGHWAGDLVWMAVPAGLVFSAYLVPRLVTDIRQALAEWSDKASRSGENRGFSTPSHLHGKNLTEITENGCENPAESPSRRAAREPEKRTKPEAREVFFAMAERGEIDPENDSVNDVAKKIGTRWGNARDFITEWQQARNGIAAA